MQVVVKNGDIQGAIRLLKRKLSRDHTSAEMRIRAYAKPSERRRKKELEAERTRKKAEKRRRYHAEENRRPRKRIIRPETYGRLVVDVRR